MVLAELSGLTAHALKGCGNSHGLTRNADRRSRLAHRGHAGANRQLAGDEIVAASSAARLRIVGIETHAFGCKLVEGDPAAGAVVSLVDHDGQFIGRGFFNPRVAGGQLGNGAMGNARWKGVPLKPILDTAGVQEGARQVTFNGLDGPAVEATPDFIKALDIDHARDGEVMVAYAMNGADLPVLNGYPLRLVVPGYYGTYWVKHLSAIEVIDQPFEGFWMTTAYRIPDNDCACVEPGTKPAATRPIGRLRGLAPRSCFRASSIRPPQRPNSFR